MGLDKKKMQSTAGNLPEHGMRQTGKLCLETQSLRYVPGLCRDLIYNVRI